MRAGRLFEGKHAANRQFEPALAYARYYVADVGDTSLTFLNRVIRAE
jgi:hypothetical protein